MPAIDWQIWTTVISEYNQAMRKCFRCAGFSSLLIPSVLLLSILSAGQAARKAPASAPAGDAEHATNLAESGHCAEALPLLKRAVRQTPDHDLKKRIALDGLRCAMTRDTPYDSLEFLVVLSRDFPHDPEALYAATHAYSDLSLRSSQDLAKDAPFSYQVHELNAEALELQGKWDDAAAEYRKILEINPSLQGMHARLGRALLSKPQPSPSDAEQAKKNFEEELEIDPRNAVAEYVLGQLAADAKDSSTAIQHFTRATKLDAGFSEAYLGLGTALNSAKRYTEAVPALETYEKMEPDSPTGHYQLALAYAGMGRREDANREAALQRQTAEALEAVKRRAATAMEKPQPNSPAPEQK
jgi:tetratricopeptide (TPR) repeat protein